MIVCRRMLLAPRSWSSGGFSLIEVIAALAIFSVITLGVVPLLASSIRASARSRASTVGKNVVVEALEHVRGLPFFVSLRGQRVDVLDFYYPDLAAPGYSSGFYTTTCTPTSTEPACAAFQIPAGYTLQLRARFVDPAADGTYETEIPASGYNWDWSTGTTVTRPDVPPTQMLEMTVTATWGGPGGDRRFSVTGLIGAKAVDRNKMNGIARIDYGVRLSTVYDVDPVDATNLVDDLTVTGGTTSTAIGSRLTTTASHTTTAATATLVRRAQDATAAETLQSITGAVASYEAPPDVTGPAPTSAAAASIGHPGLGAEIGCLLIEGLCRIGGFGPTTADEGAAEIAADLPLARGRFVHQVPAVGELDNLWINNQIGPANPLPLRPGVPFVTVQGTSTTPAGALSGNTRIDTGALTAADRRVQAQGALEVRRILIAPLEYTGSGAYAGYAVRIRNFTATVNCNSTATAGTAAATATWSATLDYWTDEPTSGTDSYTNTSVPVTSPLSLTGDNAAAQLVPLTGNNNPVVLRDSSDNPVVYLFSEPSAGRRGILTSWSSNFNISQSPNPNRTIQNSGRITAVNLDNALALTTARRNDTYPQSRVRVEVGRMTCRAEDLR